MPPVLLSPRQVASRLADVLDTGESCEISVCEERAFESEWLPLGAIATLKTDQDDSSAEAHFERGGFQWRLPELGESIELASKRLDAPGDSRDVRRALGQVADLAARVGFVHPHFDPAAIEQMPFRRSTTVVADTSGVLQGALGFVSRFLHPTARIKIPAITHMEIANKTDRFFKMRRASKCKRIPELMEHLVSQGGYRALLRLELHSDTEVERTYLLGDPLRSAFQPDKNQELSGLNVSLPIRSYADRLILEAARHHQAQSGPDHVVRLLTADQGLARMALAEGVQPLYFRAMDAEDVFGQCLTGQLFHPFSGVAWRIRLTELLWELATGFGAVRLKRGAREILRVSAIGERLAWAPYHAMDDLLWCSVKESPASQPANVLNDDSMTAKMSHRDGMDVAAAYPSTTKVNATYFRFSVDRMLRLICVLDDRMEMRAVEVREILQVKNEEEYRRFLQSGDLIDVHDEIWRSGERISTLSAALRHRRVDEVREELAQVPSFAAFAQQLRKLSRGQPLNAASTERSLRAYRILGEITLLCASAGKREIYATPNRPEPERFAEIALARFAAIDRDGHGIVGAGEWLESLIRDDGIHPEVARRLLETTNDKGLLRRSTEGSTAGPRLDSRTVHVLREDAGWPVVYRVHLYRGDYLIPGKASASLRIEELEP